MTELTQARLKGLLHFNADTGVFTWIANTIRIGRVAGGLDKNGYVLIHVDGKRRKAHRLAWLYMHGELPIEYIDHVNCIRSDNRIINLREANKSENEHNRTKYLNNKTGFKGVSWHKASQKWQSCIKVNGKQKHLGLFDTTEAAHATYCKAAKELHGKFAKLD